jgi:hypothetical protein
MTEDKGRYIAPTVRAPRAGRKAAGGGGRRGGGKRGINGEKSTPAQGAPLPHTAEHTSTLLSSSKNMRLKERISLE